MMAAGLLAFAAHACVRGDAPPPEPVRTDATSRNLLEQAGGGAATTFDGVPNFSAQMSRAYLPDLGFDRGRVEAPMKVIEFADFGCGFCRRFHQESFPTLATQFIDTGMIEWKSLPFITGSFENSLAVTEASECVLEQSDAAYQAFASMLWERQSEWKPSDEPEALARSWAAETGLDMQRYDSCLAEDRRMERVAGATVAAGQLGVRATPTFWIVGYGPLQGALPLEAFQGIFSTVHAEIVAAADSAARAVAPGA
jgi:protein-disulfide isomerase